MNEFIIHMGNSIFPQPFSEIDKVFDFEIVKSCAQKGLIQESKAQIGLTPIQVKKAKGYVELSDKGWDLFKILKPEK